jgi:predicted permease
MTHIKYAFRQLVLQRGLSITVITLLALGVGATSAMYSLINQAILAPMQVPEPDELVSIRAPGLKPGATRQGVALRDGTDPLFSYPMFQDLAAEPRGLSGLAGHQDFIANVVYGLDALLGTGVLVSGSYFDVLKVRPVLGRLIGPDDVPRVGESPVAVVSYRYWRDRLGGDPDIVGKILTVSTQPLTIIGVAPEGFGGTVRGWNPSVYVPLTLRWLMMPEQRRNDDDRQAYWVYLFGRLAPGVSREEAQLQLSDRYRSILRNVDAPALQNVTEQQKAQYLDGRIVLEPGARGQVYTRLSASNPLTLALGVTLLVLLIVCGNIANLLLARGASRAGEMAIRVSLGANRSRLAAQLLTESGVLAAIGGLLSFPVAFAILRVVSAVVPQSFTSQLLSDRLDASSSGAAVFAAGATLVTVILFGLVPALSTGRADPAGVIKAQSRQSPGGRGIARFRSMLAAGQISLSLALLVLAGLFTRSLVNVANIDLGMNVDSVISVNLAGALTGKKGAELDAFYARVRDELSALPGVESVASTVLPLLNRSVFDTAVTVVGSEQQLAENSANVNRNLSPGFFKTLSIPLLAGRDFTDADSTQNPSIAIVNQSFVRKFDLGPDAVGKSVQLKGQFGPQGAVTIVGVVADAQYAFVKGAVPAQIYTPRPPLDASSNNTVYVVRSTVDPNTLIETVRRVLRDIAPGVSPGIVPITQAVATNTATDRLMSLLSVTFGGLATLLAAIGLYGVLAFNVTQRRRELALRLALGATPRKLRVLVLKEVAVMASIGGAIGLAAAFGGGRLAQRVLYGISGFDPAVVLAAVAVLAAVLLVAAYFPARRASNVAPMQALRDE